MTVLGLVEHEAGRVSERSLEMLTLARRLADTTGAGLRAAMVGAEARALAGGLSAFGVDAVYVIEDDRLAEYAPGAWAASLAGIIEAEGVQAALASGTDRGNEVMAHLAARAGLPMAANCTEVEPGDSYTVTRLRWGGSLLEEAQLTAPVKLLTIAPHALEAEETREARETEVRAVTPALSDADLAVRVVERGGATGGGIALADARVVVGGGRGVGSAEGFGLLEELAGLLNAAVGCSRVATSEGWRPHADQVGLTGSRIAPDLYVACGISGAFQHLVGCKGAKHILAINKDPQAPIVQRADWAIIGDLHEVLPALSAAVRAARGA